MEDLWMLKHRPDTLAGYVFENDKQKKQVQSWIDDGSIPHLFFYGPAGTGKTTLAKVLISELGVNEFDILEINASMENSVDDIRKKILGFVETMPFGEFKVVLLDEIDYMSKPGQAALRNVMETHADSARFILTCNYKRKVIDALISRCQGFHISKMDRVEFTATVAEALIDEKVEFDIETLDLFVDATYPDMRKTLNLLHMNSVTGTLLKPDLESGTNTSEFKVAAIELIKNRNYREAREVICAHINADEIDGMWRWMYEHLDLWGDTDEEKDKAIIIIRKGLVNHSLVADPEINLSACLVELSQIR